MDIAQTCSAVCTKRAQIVIGTSFIYPTDFAIIKLMVKKSGEPEAQSATGPVVGGGSGRRLPTINRKWAWVILAILIAGLAFWAYRYHSTHTNQGVVVLKSEKQVVGQELKDALAHPPSQTGSQAEQTAYYEKLMKIQETLGDYNAATRAFQAREQISSEGLDYSDYYNAANDACKAADKTSASDWITKAKSMLPANDNPDAGYVRANVVVGIDALAQGCGI